MSSATGSSSAQPAIDPAEETQPDLLPEEELQREPEHNPEYGKINEQAVARLRNRLGKVVPIKHPYLRHVNQDSITHVAR